MKIAIALHDNMVSSVFDFARYLLIADYQGGVCTDQQKIDLGSDNQNIRVSALVENSVNVLICGSISRCLAGIILASGIEVVPFVSGSAEQILQAYVNGSLGDIEFLQPGCGRGARRGFCRGGRRRGRGFGRAPNGNPNSGNKFTSKGNCFYEDVL